MKDVWRLGKQMYNSLRNILDSNLKALNTENEKLASSEATSDIFCDDSLMQCAT